ncbi:MAG: hypothetical protein ACWGQW_09135, partial [bacterium]
DYCVDYVTRIQMQSLEYYAFICNMREQLDDWAKQTPGSSKASTFIAQMRTELSQVEEMYHSRVERDGRKTPQEHMAYAAELGARLKILIQDPGDESFPEAKFILDSFNALSAATDEDVPAGFGITIRHMFQEAGSSCGDNRKQSNTRRKLENGYGEEQKQGTTKRLGCKARESTPDFLDSGASACSQSVLLGREERYTNRNNDSVWCGDDSDPGRRLRHGR